MNIVLDHLKISGFKGIRELELSFNGASAIIGGRNGTGKTSVYDAVLWLLFGKDSADTKADVKPVDENGERISGKDVDVTATYAIDGKPVTLRRQLREVWSKQDGTAEKVYARDETLCWIGGVPKKIDKEYLPTVCAMFGVDEGMFKLLSNHTAFMAMHWTERRKYLLGMISPEKVVVNGFEHIGDILMGNTPEDARKRLMEQRKRLNDQLNNIPARLDELQRSVSVVTDDELRAAKEGLRSAQDEIEDIDKQLSTAGDVVAAMNADITHKANLERRKLTAETMLRSDHQERLNKLNARMSEYKSLIQTAQQEITTLNAAIERNLNNINDSAGRKEELLAEYKRINAETYVESTDNEYCPTCKQMLPPDRIEAANEADKAAWNNRKRAKLNVNVEAGKREKEAIESLQSTNVSFRERVARCEDRIRETEERVEEVKGLIAEEEADFNPVTPEIETLQAEIEAADAKIKKYGTNEMAEELRDRKRTLNANMATFNATIATAGAQENNKKRVAELEEEKRVAGDALNAVERDLETLGKFVSARCTLLEESINGRFSTIRWKLFSQLKNGNIEDCCDATVNGVPYGAGLNNAAEVNAGIEIIRELSRHAGVNLPCFIDNAESVNHVAATGGQMILLTVTEDPTLTYTLID